MENTYTYSPLDRVIWDTQATDAILNEVERLNVDKVYIVASSTLSKKTDEISKIKNILGNKFVSKKWELELYIERMKGIINELEKNPDIIITVGGGTPIDTVKVVQLCHSLEINT